MPVSTTYLTLGMVRDVSATLVATTHNRIPGGGGSNTFRTTERNIEQVHATENKETWAIEVHMLLGLCQHVAWVVSACCLVMLLCQHVHGL